MDQMKNMGRIYRMAAEIMIWLGPDPQGHGRQAMKYIKEIASLLCEDNDEPISPSELWRKKDMKEVIRGAKKGILLPQPAWKSLHWFFSLRWFSRVWMIQEANAGTKVTARCGPNEIDWHEIVLVAELFVKSPTTADPLKKLDGTSVWHAAAMRWVEFRHADSLLETLDFARNFDATEGRDHIYALFGLPVFEIHRDPQDVDSMPLNLRDDANMSDDDVYTDLAEKWISKSGNLNILASVQNNGSIKAPSWVPRWDQKQQANVMFKSRWSTWNAYSDMPMKWSLNEKILTARGITLDLVSETASIEKFEALFPFRRPDGSDSASDYDFRRHFWKKQTSGISTDQHENWLKTYSMVFSWGINGDWTHINPSEQAASFQEYLQEYHHESHRSQLPFCKELCKEMRENGIDEIMGAARTASWGRILFRTTSGYVGMGPKGMLENDMVCIIYGCKMPMILRRKKGGDSLIGEGYVYEIMNGQAIEKMRSEQLGGIVEEDFELH